MKRIFTFLLALMMALVLAVPAFAEETYSITIKNAAAGHTYEAYQIFAGDLHEKVLSNIAWGNGVNGTALLAALKADTAIGSDFTSCNSAADVAEVLATYVNGAEKTKQFAKVAGSNLTTAAGTSTEEKATYTISNLAAGYYLVKDKNDTLAGKDDFYTAYIMEVVGNVTALPKGDKPTLDKQIKHNESGAWGVVGDNQIGDTVEFRIITTVPHTTGYTTYDYIIHDTMSAGLTSNVKGAADVTIKVNDTTVLDQAYYTVTVNEKNPNSFTVKVDILKAIADGKMTHNNKLYTYYTGVLNADAKIYDEGKQDNVAYLEYSNNPNDNDGKGETPEKIVYDWTFKMVVNKVDGNGDPLTDAKFVLSKNGGLKVADMNCDDNGVPAVKTGLIGLVKVSDGVYRVAVAGDTDVVHVIDAGRAVIKGLDDATDYYLYETKAPAGYNLLKKPVQFEITAEYLADGSALAVNHPTVTVDNGESSTTLSANIVNNSGSTLPSTGGIGTTIFYVVGSVLVIGAAVVLITRKRMGKSDK